MAAYMGSYKLLKTVRFFGPPCAAKLEIRVNVLLNILVSSLWVSRVNIAVKLRRVTLNRGIKYR